MHLEAVLDVMCSLGLALVGLACDSHTCEARKSAHRDKPLESAAQVDSVLCLEVVAGLGLDARVGGGNDEFDLVGGATATNPRSSRP